MRRLVCVPGQSLIVERARRVRVQREIELVFPPKIETRARDRIVTAARSRVALRQICRVGSDLVGDHTGLHVVAIGQPQMLFRRDIAKHCRSEPADHRRADGRRDVVVTGRDVGSQRPERVERRFRAVLELLVHVLLDLVHRDVARAFDHHLAVPGPRDLRQLTECLQLRELGGVIRIGDRSRSQAIAKGKAHVIRAADIADLVEVLVEEAFAMMREAPLRHDRAAARNNAGDARRSERNVLQPHAGMDREVVDALLRLLDERVAEHFPAQVLRDAVHSFERLIDRHGADGHRRIAQDPLADLMDVPAGGEIHHRVRAPADRPHHLVHFLGHR